MIPINKDEKEAIVKRFPYIKPVRTMIGDSKRHNYYVVEDRKVLQFIDNYRKRKILEDHRPNERGSGENAAAGKKTR